MFLPSPRGEGARRRRAGEGSFPDPAGRATVLRPAGPSQTSMRDACATPGFLTW